MTQEELIVVRDAIDLVLALPNNIRELLAQWLKQRSQSLMASTIIPLCPHRRPRLLPCRAQLLQPSVTIIPPTHDPLSRSFSP
jgi:hypothetical protein